MNTDSPIHTLVATALRAALVLALLGAGWSVYRRLPGGESPLAAGEGQTAETSLHIVLRPARGNPAGAPLEQAQFKLYSIDVEATQREFLSEPRRGERLEDFMMRRMGDRTPLEGQFDGRGQANIAVRPGQWWVHATLPGAREEVTWRLRLNVSGREQTVELTPENAYTRTKSF